MLTAIRVFSLAGLILFGPVLLVTLLAPQQAEQAARSFIEAEARQEVDRYLDSFAGQTLEKTYEALRAKYEQQLADQESALEADLPSVVAELLAGLCHYDCRTKAELRSAVTAGMENAIAGLERVLGTVWTLAQEKYSEITAKIRRDLMIFSGSNSAIFGLLLALTFLRREDTRPLAVPAALMLIATAASTGIYVFGQDWFWVILTDSYMGFGYLGYVAVIFLFLADIVYNQAQITQGILEGIVQVLSKCLPT